MTNEAGIGLFHVSKRQREGEFISGDRETGRAIKVPPAADGDRDRASRLGERMYPGLDLCRAEDGRDARQLA